MALPGQKTRADYIPFPQFVSLLHQLKRDGDYKFRLLIAIGVFTGLRISDILNLRWSDILYRNFLIINEQKTGKEREIPINDDFYKIILDCYKNLMPLDKNDYIFRNKKGGILSVQYVNKKLKHLKYKYRLKIKYFSTHSLRKTFGRKVWEDNYYSDKALILLSEIFSHTSIADTKKYLGIKKEEIDNIYSQIRL